MGESWATNAAVRATMLGNRSKDTKPEIALRQELHRLGLRYRVNARPIKEIRRTADVVFTRRKVAVFLDGCFWHCCPIHGTQPKSNAEYWTPKLARNVERDHHVNDVLTKAGWEVVRVWEHESHFLAAARIAEIVRARA